MKKGNRALIFISLSVALFVSLALWAVVSTRSLSVHLPDAEPTAAVNSENGNKSTSESAAEQEHSRAANASPQTHPPLTAPPAETLGQLLQAAHAGNASAQCRVGIEYAICDTLDRHGDELLSQATFNEQRLSTGTGLTDATQDAVITGLAEMQIRLLERRRDCRELPASQGNSGTDWLARAASAGHREATIRYLLGESIGHLERGIPSSQGRFEILGHPNTPAWLRNAPRLARERLDQGDPDVLFLLLRAYQEDRDPFSSLITNDPVEAAALTMIARRLMDGRTDNVLEGLSAEQTAQARLRIATLEPRFAATRYDSLLQSRPSTPSIMLISANTPAEHLGTICQQ